MVAIPVTGNKGKEWMARGPVGLHVKVPCFFATHATFFITCHARHSTVGLNRSTRWKTGRMWLGTAGSLKVSEVSRGSGKTRKYSGLL